MILKLALRHLLVRPGRALLLLFGYGVGAGVMMVLLAVGHAMLEQSRDLSLVGGGEVTVLPEGIDLDALRTGSLDGYFFGIDRARFITRQLLGGPRESPSVRSVSPQITPKLLYLTYHDRTVMVRAVGEIPSRAKEAGTAATVLEGGWVDTPRDSAWIAPTADQLYNELDRWHYPKLRDSTWAEWQYFNIKISESEWWYLTFMVAGQLPSGSWGGRLLVTHRRPDGTHRGYLETFTPSDIELDTLSARVTMGAGGVEFVDGRWLLSGQARTESDEALTFQLEVVPEPHRWFPPVELESQGFVSGYVVPALRASGSGKICVAERCRVIEGAAAYHDHNWGVWRGVSWEWGIAQGSEVDLLYGGVSGGAASQGGSAPFFLAVADRMGVAQVLRFDQVGYSGSRSVTALPGVYSPDSMTILAARGIDTLRVAVSVASANATPVEAAGLRRALLQLRGRFTVTGRVAGQVVSDSGGGFFETWREIIP